MYQGEPQPECSNTSMNMPIAGMNSHTAVTQQYNWNAVQNFDEPQPGCSYSAQNAVYATNSVVNTNNVLQQQYDWNPVQQNEPQPGCSYSLQNYANVTGENGNSIMQQQQQYAVQCTQEPQTGYSYSDNLQNVPNHGANDCSAMHQDGSIAAQHYEEPSLNLENAVNFFNDANELMEHAPAQDLHLQNNNELEPQVAPDVEMDNLEDLSKFLDDLIGTDMSTFLGI